MLPEWTGSSPGDRRENYADTRGLLTVYVYPATLCRRIQWALIVPLWAASRKRIADRFNLEPRNPPVYPAYLADPLGWAYVITRRLMKRMG